MNLKKNDEFLEHKKKRIIYDVDKHILTIYTYQHFIPVGFYIQKYTIYLIFYLLYTHAI